jgi:hypothetical protein
LIDSDDGVLHPDLAVLGLPHCIASGPPRSWTLVSLTISAGVSTMAGGAVAAVQDLKTLWEAAGRSV